MAQEPDPAVEMIGVSGLFEPVPQRTFARDHGAHIGLHVLE